MEAFIRTARMNRPTPLTRVLLNMFDEIEDEAFSLRGLLDGYGDTPSFGREI
jgi:hypothetical protein